MSHWPWIGLVRMSMSISDRPKPEFKPKPKYRNFGLVWTDTETETERRSIPKPKPKPKPKFLVTKNFLFEKQETFLSLLKQTTHNKDFELLGSNLQSNLCTATTPGTP
jgi:hypothetical protein